MHDSIGQERDWNKHKNAHAEKSDPILDRDQKLPSSLSRVLTHMLTITDWFSHLTLGLKNAAICFAAGNIECWFLSIRCMVAMAVSGSIESAIICGTRTHASHLVRSWGKQMSLFGLVMFDGSGLVIRARVGLSLISEGWDFRHRPFINCCVHWIVSGKYFYLSDTQSFSEMHSLTCQSCLLIKF